MGATPFHKTRDDDRAAAPTSPGRRHGDPRHGAGEHWLRHVSYYRLSAYWRPFEYPKGNPGPVSYREPVSAECILDQEYRPANGGPAMDEEPLGREFMITTRRGKNGLSRLIIAEPIDPTTRT